MTETRAWTRCIVLTPDGVDVGAPIKRLAAARDWVTVEQHDPYLVMAELCIRRRAQRSRKSWGLPSAERLSLIIAEPRAWSELDDLIAAVERFAGDVPLYTFVDGELKPHDHEAEPGPNRGETVDQAPTPGPTDDRPVTAPEAVIEATPASARPLRLASADADTGAPDEDFDEARDENHDEDEYSASISPEEMEMLLAAPPGYDAEEES